MPVKKKSSNVHVAILNVVTHAIQEKKGNNIQILDLKKIPSAITDYFILVSGGSDTQLDAIADSIEMEVKETLNEKPLSKEGSSKDGWLILDYFSIVIHLFLPQKRDFYNLEELWGDAKITTIE